MLGQRTIHLFMLRAPPWLRSCNCPSCSPWHVFDLWGHFLFCSCHTLLPHICLSSSILFHNYLQFRLHIFYPTSDTKLTGPGFNKEVFIDTTDKAFKTVMNTEHHQNFKNHSQQIILYSCIQYPGFIALTPVSNTVLHRFASTLHNALCSSAVAISLHSVFHTCYPLYATHCLAFRILSKSCRSLVLYRVYRISRTFYTIPSSAEYP